MRASSSSVSATSSVGGDDDINAPGEGLDDDKEGSQSRGVGGEGIAEGPLLDGNGIGSGVSGS